MLAVYEGDIEKEMEILRESALNSNSFETVPLHCDNKRQYICLGLEAQLRPGDPGVCQDPYHAHR